MSFSAEHQGLHEGLHPFALPASQGRFYYLFPLDCQSGGWSLVGAACRPGHASTIPSAIPKILPGT